MGQRLSERRDVSKKRLEGLASKTEKPSLSIFMAATFAKELGQNFKVYDWVLSDFSYARCMPQDRQMASEAFLKHKTV
jgi:hypothetical protein